MPDLLGVVFYPRFRDRQILDGPSMILLGFSRGSKIFDGATDLALPQIGKGPIVMGLHVAWPQGERLRERRHRLVQFSMIPERNAEIVLGFDMVRVERQCLLIRRNRLRELP